MGWKHGNIIFQHAVFQKHAKNIEPLNDLKWQVLQTCQMRVSYLFLHLARKKWTTPHITPSMQATSYNEKLNNTSTKWYLCETTGWFLCTLIYCEINVQIRNCADWSHFKALSVFRKGLRNISDIHNSYISIFGLFDKNATLNSERFIIMVLTSLL